MFEKMYSYTNLNGEKVRKFARFNLRKDELYVDIAGRGRLIDEYAKITDGLNPEDIKPEDIRSRDRMRLLTFIDDFLCLAYGEKSEDGEYFEKSPAITHKFKCSPLYEAVFMDVLEHPEAFKALIKGTMPSEMGGVLDEYLNVANADSDAN